MSDAAETIDGVFRAKPRLALTVGFTGHRTLDAGAGTWLGPAIVEILERLARELVEEQKRSAAAFSDEPPLLRMISGLAEGADTIAAHAAIAAHVELDVILPFSREEFANDFESDVGKADLNILISRACEVVELPGIRAHQTAAYEQVGVAMLSQADLIIAVWNSKVARGRGGTAEVVGHAVERTIPVIHLPPEEGAAPAIIWSGLEGLPLARPTAWTTPLAPLDDRIGDVVRTLVAPPVREEGEVDLEAVLARPPRRTQWLSLAWPLMLAATLVRGLRRIDIVLRRPSTLLAEAAALLPVTDANFRGRIEQQLLTLGARADAFATAFGQMHRSSFVLNFALAAFAVAFAIAGVPRDGAYQAWVAPLELAALLAIVVNTWLGLRGKWHEKWLEFRHLAERCRVLAMALPLGEPLLRFENSERAGGVPDWVRWRSRAAVRAVGMPTLLIDDVQVAAMRARLIKEIEGQREYHDGQWHRMHDLDHRTHFMGLGLFGLSLAASAVHCAVLFYEWRTHHHLEAEWFADLVLFITAVAPAAGAAIYGIRVLGEFAGIARQSHVMVGQFDDLLATVEADPPDYRLITDRMRRLASIMLHETADWRLTFESRPFGLPS